MKKTTQHQLTEIDRHLLQGFRTTSHLHSSLSRALPKPKQIPPALLFSAAKTQSYLKEAEKELKGKNTRTNFNIESEVKSLTSHPKIQIIERTALMIEKQKESRRQRHIAFLKEFEKIEETMEKSGELTVKKIQDEVELFFNNSSKEINNYLNSLTDSELLTRENDFIEDLAMTIQKHKNKRNEKIFNFYTLIHTLESDRIATINQICEKLEEDLMETSFILEPEIKELREKKFIDLEKKYQEFMEKNRLILETFNQKETLIFEKFEQEAEEKDKKWRLLKHEEALLCFRTEIQTLEFINPEERKKLYKNLKNLQLDLFKEKELKLNELLEEMPKKLTKIRVEKWLEELRLFIETSNEKIDKSFENLLKEHENRLQKSNNRLEMLKERLFFLRADIGDKNLNELIEEEAEFFVKKINEDGRELMSLAIKFVEEKELKSNDFLMNLGGFVMKFASKFDEQKNELNLFKKKYELKKAKIADDNDEKVKILQSEFKSLKNQMKLSIHHPSLEENIVKCFTKLDELEKEYRDFNNKNLELSHGNPDSIRIFFKNIEQIHALQYSLSPQSSLSDLQQRNLQRAQAKVQQLLAEEETNRIKEEEKQAEEAKKKGGKIPAKPKKDPKKAQAELEIHQKELLEQVGIEKIEEYNTPLGTIFLLNESLQEIVIRLFQPLEQEGKNNQEEQQLVNYISPKDPQNNQILDENVVFQIDKVSYVLEKFRKSLFNFIFELQNQNLEEASILDHNFIEESIEILDNRLKIHYPLKGKLEVKTFAIRSAEITDHKRRYERFVRSTLDKLNQQTEEFNYLLENSLQEVKDYESDQTKLRENLGLALSLPKLQGLLNTVRENVYKFEERIREKESLLDNLASKETNILLTGIEKFIENCKLFSEKGNYSEEEKIWYKNMLKEIEIQIQTQQKTKQEKQNEIISLLKKKKIELLENFEKNYTISIEELACSEGTGKKYGRPRRLYQEKLRSEMTKCEKAQEGINKNIEEIKILYENYKKNPGLEDLSISIRGILMKIRTCMGRYASHIQAIKPDNKLTEMPRISYNELKFDIVLEENQLEKDKILKEKELLALGPLFYQKETRTFSEWILDIEKSVKEESQKIYIGPANKFLTGTDKIPDYLRIYLENNRKIAEEFRLSSVRQLRNSCEELSKIYQIISEMTLESIKNRYLLAMNNNNNQLEKEFNNLFNKSESDKKILDYKLRPNLSNPTCRPELDSVCLQEKERVDKILSESDLYKEKQLNNQFKLSNDFFKVFLSNTEFLLCYSDNMILFEDFIRLPGDEDIIKKHDNLKTLLKRKQKGFLIDTSSERSIMKVWPGILIDSFRIDEKKIEYSLTQVVIENKKEKNKKEEPEIPSINTKDIKSFKTYRQKSVINFRNKGFAEFKKLFDQNVEKIKSFYKKIVYEEQKYQFFWDQKVDKLINH